jgi:uncharacterized protein YjiS (DUF1127 family)
MSFTEISGSVASIFDRFVQWAERASQRRILSELDDNMLKDIGLTRHDAFKESVRPFWDGSDQPCLRALRENESARRDWPSGRRNRPLLSAGTIIGNKRDGRYSCS